MGIESRGDKPLSGGNEKKIKPHKSLSARLENLEQLTVELETYAETQAKQRDIAPVLDDVKIRLERIEKRLAKVDVFPPRAVELKLSPVCAAFVRDVREAEERPAVLPLPKDVRECTLEAIQDTPEYREAVEKLGTAMPEIPEAYKVDTFNRIMATSPDLDPPDNIPVRWQRIVVRAAERIADRAGSAGATPGMAEEAVALASLVLDVDRPPHLVITPENRDAMIAEVKRNVVPYLKLLAVERPLRADDTPGWDLLAVLGTSPIAGFAEGGKALTGAVLEEAEAGKLAAAFFDVGGAIYEQFKIHAAEVAHERLQEKADAARTYLLEWGAP